MCQPVRYFRSTGKIGAMKFAKFTFALVTRGEEVFKDFILSSFYTDIYQYNKSSSISLSLYLMHTEMWQNVTINSYSCTIIAVQLIDSEGLMPA